MSKAGGLSPAATLLIEDELKNILEGRGGLRKDKMSGLVPMGSHSVFGNFPGEYMAPRWKRELQGRVPTKPVVGAGALARRPIKVFRTPPII